VANTINIDASSQLTEVTLIHSQVADFCRFLRDQVKPAIGTSYKLALNIPAKAQKLINDKAAFDNLSFSGALTKRILEKDLGYTDWTATHTTDLNGIIAKAATIQAFIESEVAKTPTSFPASYNANHEIQYITASAQLQTDLTAQIDSIINAHVNLNPNS